MASKSKTVPVPQDELCHLAEVLRGALGDIVRGDVEGGLVVNEWGLSGYTRIENVIGALQRYARGKDGEAGAVEGGDGSQAVLPGVR